ncbi:GNAT family N-acetyltransferase [Georgenia sp. 311]|uniref:GNAT family N-acetyltransferase n=1 Tax=Georgenia sp. 311 TaxID=2585134 RepID=UPI001112BDA3|nr:GNAT family N-acetyltransferase [Georgenia sp. 311]TNC17371.1 GNAT family N-acetyltransferase [Georgenia sp. 311]
MAGPLHVRPARPDDADALADLETRARREAEGSEEVGAPQDAVQRWRDRLSDPGGSMTWVGVVRATGEPVGIATAEATGPGDLRPLRLLSLHVEPQWRGQGLGQVLLDHAVGDAPCYLWVGQDDARAQRFYERNGFAPDGARREERAGPELRLVR